MDQNPTPTSATAGVPETTDDARRFLVEWHRANWKHAPFFGNYISTELAGDFAFHLARWLAQPRVAEQADPITYTVDGEVMSPLEYIAYLHDQLNARQAAPEAPAEPIGYVSSEQLEWLKHRDAIQKPSVQLWKGKVPLDAVPVYAPAPATPAAPKHETIIREGGSLVCTACGTSAATDQPIAGQVDERTQKALASIVDRLALTYRICCGTAPKQSVGELLDVTINMPEWEIVRASLTPTAPQAASQQANLAHLIVSTAAGVDRLAVLVSVKRDDITTILYSRYHSMNGDSMGVESISAEVIAPQAATTASTENKHWCDSLKPEPVVGGRVCDCKPTATTAIKPDPEHLVALALSGALPDQQAGEVLRDAFASTTTASGEPPFGYAVEQPDGHVTFFKEDPTGFRQKKWADLGTIVHTLYSSRAPAQAAQPALPALPAEPKGAKLYRKTALVRAEQFLPGEGQIPDGVYSDGHGDPRKNPLLSWVLDTKEGKHYLRNGDYICTGAQGEKWNVEQSIFESTYELAAPGAAQTTDARDGGAK